MSKLTPLIVDLRDDAPISTTSVGRPTGHEKGLFLQDKIDDLEGIGLLTPAMNPICASRAFAVPKKGPKKYRVVTDMRGLNKWSKKTALLMPNLDEQLCRFGN